MRKDKLLLRLAATLFGVALAAPPAVWAASDGEEGGGAVTVQTVAEAMIENETHLTELLGQVPEQAREEIGHAIAASREGRRRALQAFETKSDAEVGAEADAQTHAKLEGSSAEAGGAVEARVAIRASSERTEEALRNALQNVRGVGAARRRIKEAIDHGRVTRDRALNLIDRIDRPDLPERIEAASAVDAAVRLDRPHRR